MFVKNYSEFIMNIFTDFYLYILYPIYLIMNHIIDTSVDHNSFTWKRL